MRRKKTMSIADVLTEYKKVMNINKKLKEVEIINAWENIVGKPIAKHTSKIYINDGVLHILCNSSVVRNELMMKKDIIICRVNEVAGEDLIQKAVLR